MSTPSGEVSGSTNDLVFDPATGTTFSNVSKSKLSSATSISSMCSITEENGNIAANDANDSGFFSTEINKPNVSSSNGNTDQRPTGAAVSANALLEPTKKPKTLSLSQLPKMRSLDDSTLLHSATCSARQHSHATFMLESTGSSGQRDPHLYRR